MNESAHKDKLFDLLLHSENTFTSRTNFFLVAEAMFLVAYVTAGESDKVLQLILVLGGFSITTLWLWLQWRTTNNLEKLATKIHADVLPELKTWRDECRKSYIIRLATNKLIGKCLPSLILIMWACIIIFSLKI